MVGHRDMPVAYNRIAYRFRLKAFEEAVDGGLPSWPRVTAFVAGFGPGFYLDYLHRHGVEDVWGVDLTEAAVEHASGRFPGYRLLQHDITQPLALRKRSHFDLVTAIDVLFHILEDDGWKQALEQLCSLLRPGGRLLLTDKFPVGAPRSTSSTVRWRPVELYESVLAAHGVSLERMIPVFLWMDEAITCGVHPGLGILSKAQWTLLRTLGRALERWPALQQPLFRTIASAQAPVERLSLALLRRSPNLEMVVARKD